MTAIPSHRRWTGPVAIVLAALAVRASADDPGATAYRSYAGVDGDLLGQSVAAAGDLNGDGVPDYIIGIPGFGPFAAGRAVVRSGATGNVMRTFDGGSVADLLGASVAGAGDFNNDGRDDVIVGSPFNFMGADVGGAAFVYSGVDGSELAVFAGDQEAEQLGTAVAGAGDVNGDGYADVIVGSPLYDGTLGQSTGRVMIYSGIDGSLLLQRESLAGGRLGASVTGIGDVNGDGYDDVAAGAPGVATVYIIDVEHALTIRTLSNFAFSSSFGKSIVNIGDVDGDGVSDLLVGAPDYTDADSTAGKAYVYSGADGSLIDTFRGISNNDQFGIAVGAAGDYDGDTVPDFIIGIPRDDRGGTDAGRVEVRSGATGLVLAAVNAGAPYSEFAMAVAGIGDIDNDGLSDIIVGCPRSDVDDRGRAFVYRGVASPLGLDPAVDYATTGNSPEFLTTVDLNGDEFPDMVSTSPATDTLSILINNGDGTFAAPVNMQVGDAPTSVAAGDFDADDDMDLAVASSKTNRIVMFRNDGTGVLTKIGGIVTGKKPRSIAVADFNHDGRADLAVVNQSDDNVWVFNNTASSAALHQRFASPQGYVVRDGPLFVATGDQNGDNRADLYVVCQTENRLCVLLNKGNGDFFKNKATSIPALTAWVAVGDLNNDGLDDVAITNRAAGQVIVRHSNGNGTFDSAAADVVGASPRSVAMFDMNLDGWLDLVCADQADNTCTYLVNNQAGGFAPGVTVITGTDPIALAVGDVDGDGDSDICTADRAGQAISVMLNTWF